MVANPIITELSCFHAGDGAVNVGVTGGTAPYSYAWSIPGVPSSSSSTHNLTQSQLYPRVCYHSYWLTIGRSVAISDAHGCTVPNLTVVNVLQAPGKCISPSNVVSYYIAVLSVSYDVTPIKCYGGSATVSATAQGGLGPYTYSWSGNTTYTITPQPSTTPVFVDSFTTPFGLPAGLNQSILCAGTGELFNLNFAPSYSGYCSLVSYPSPSNLTVFSVGCPQCIDTTKVFYITYNRTLFNFIYSILEWSFSCC